MQGFPPFAALEVCPSVTLKTSLLLGFVMADHLSGPSVLAGLDGAGGRS